MTDEELIQLVQSRSPGELSLDEIELLRKRLRESDELRDAFSSRLPLQSKLAEILARIESGEDDPLRAGLAYHSRSGRRAWAWGLATVLASVIIVASIFWWIAWGERSVVSQEDERAGGSQLAATIESADRAEKADANPDEASEVGDRQQTSGRAEDEFPAEGEFPAEDAAEPPWLAVLGSHEEPRSFDEMCLDRFGTVNALPQLEELQAWFDVIVGQPNGIVETTTRLGQCAAIEGIVHLKSPWTDDSALRLSLVDYNRLQIHLFHGERGITLIYHEDRGHGWAAYATVRKAGGFTPVRWALTATDQSRNQRTGIGAGGPFELRYRNDEVIMTRGDIVLLRAPLEGKPEDVYFQGKAAFHGIAIVRCRDDFTDHSKRPLAFDCDKPAEQLAWHEHLDEKVKFASGERGSVLLRSDKASRRSWVSTLRPRDDLYELVFEVDEATAGAGIYLGDGTKPPRAVLRYVRDRRTRQLCLVARGNDDHRVQSFPPVHERLLPCVDGRHWIRIVIGCNSVRWWMSVDGEHWAAADEPIRGVAADVRSIGLHCVAGAPCRIRLLRVRGRTLPAFPSLVDDATKLVAFAKPDAATFDQWLVVVTQLQPAAWDTETWRRACALQTLSAGCGGDLGAKLTNLLLDDARARRLPFRDQLDLLGDAALLLDLFDDSDALKAFVQRYHALGWQLQTEMSEGPFTTLRRALIETPILTRHRLEIWEPDAMRVELLGRMYGRNADKALELCRLLSFFHLDAKVPLVRWAESVAARRAPDTLGRESVSRLPEAWRELLIEQLSKDVYNKSAELQALLDSRAYDDAAQLVASLVLTDLPGVAPYVGDDRLLVGLGRLIELEKIREPRFQAAIANADDRLARLRVRRAISVPDPAQVEHATIQFAGTDAAREAHRWLGERALSSGWFDMALAHLSLASGSGAEDEELEDRISLAALMAGATGLTNRTLRIGSDQITEPETEALAVAISGGPTAIRNARRTATSFEGGHLVTPPPSQYTVERRARLEGAVGRDPHRPLNGYLRHFAVDWVGRQIGFAVDGSDCFVNNRFQVAAYDLTDGSLKWRSPQLQGRILRSHDWSLTAMRPLVIGDRLFARQLYGEGGSLTCLNRENGEPVWVGKRRQNVEIISDPMMLCDELVCLTLQRNEQRQSTIRLTTFDAETGALWREHDLVQVRESWFRRRCCEVQEFRGRIVAQLGGIVICCDRFGSVLWVRKHLVLPPDEEPSWVNQDFAPPVVFGERIIVSQPGVRTLDCLDPETGRQIWSRLLPGMRGVVGTFDGEIVVRADSGLVAVGAVDGEVRWRSPIQGMLVGILASGENGILCSLRVQDKSNAKEFDTRLMWVDAATGRPTHATMLDGVTGSDPQFGPIFRSGERVWAFCGNGPNDANRDLLELVSIAPAQVEPDVAATESVWLRSERASLRAESRHVFPNWTLLSGDSLVQPAAPPPESPEGGPVLATRSRRNDPTVFARRVNFPEGSAPRLRLHVGSKPGFEWRVEVMFNGRRVWTTTVTDESHPELWKEFAVELNTVAGDEGCLTVHGHYIRGDDKSPIYWQAMDVGQ